MKYVVDGVIMYQADILTPSYFTLPRIFAYSLFMSVVSIIYRVSKKISLIKMFTNITLDMRQFLDSLVCNNCELKSVKIKTKVDS